jgi:hypothetical protein
MVMKCCVVLCRVLLLTVTQIKAFTENVVHIFLTS